MIKRAAVLLVGAGCFFGAAAVSATPYDDCIRDFAKQGPTGDYEYSVCMKQEAARLLTEIQKVYTKIANDKYYSKWNNGNGMFKGRVRDTYNAWLVYRNNYCDMYAEAAKNTGGSEAYNREQCRKKLTEEQLDARILREF
ncbi:MAG: DUF1311 domain-containing protein, partial [Alphaproteobacteria bacterium]|nr:DUF1311 domain-containing protein [Alphaproteobacteria bacterium]